MKLAIGIIVCMCFMYPQHTKSLNLTALTAGLNDTQLVALAGDVLIHNPPLLNSLKETVFAGLPLLSDISPPSLHNKEISQVLTLWIEEELPRVVNSSHIKNFVKVFVDNINEIQTTDFSRTNPKNYMHDVFSNMDFVKILKEFTEKEEEFIEEVSESINVTTIMKLAPETKQLLDSIGVPPKVSSAISKATPYLFLVAQELITSLSKVNQTQLDKNDSLLMLVLKYANFTPTINDFLHQSLFSKFLFDKDQKLILESIANGIFEGGRGFLLSYGPKILQTTITKILGTNMTGINSSNPNAFYQFIQRLDVNHLLINILQVVNEPIAKFLHIQSDKLISLTTTLLQNLPVITKLISDGIKILKIQTAGQGLGLLQSVDLKAILKDVGDILFQPQLLKQSQADQPSCGANTIQFLTSIFGTEKWALDMLDAAGKPPTGILRGALHWPGNFDQCLAINPNATFGTRYCRVSLKVPDSLVKSIVGDVHLFGITPSATIGLCLPDSCTMGNISPFLSEGIVGTLLNLTGLNPLSVYCDHELALSKDDDAILVISFICIVVFVVLLCTCIHGFKWHSDTADEPELSYLRSAYRVSQQPAFQGYDNKGFQARAVPNDYDDISDTKLETSFIQKTSTDTNGDIGAEETRQKGEASAKESLDTKDSKNNSKLVIHTNDDIADDLIKSGLNTEKSVNKYVNMKSIVTGISLLNTLTQITSYKREKGRIACIDGIRVLSMLMIMLGMTYLFTILPLTDGPVSSDLLDALDMIKRVSFQFVMSGQLDVDTFFLISGCLITYTLLKKNNKLGHFQCGTVLVKFFHRYIRLTPCYIIFLFIYVYLYNYLQSGPSWPESLKVAEKCKSTAWHNVLHVNNLVGVQGNDAFSQCMPWSWFLATLMQLHLATLILFPLILYSYRLSAFIYCVIIICGSVAAGLKQRQYGGDLLTSVEDQGAYWNNIYITPWCRASPYVVGILLGMMLYKHNFPHEVTERKLNKIVVFFGWVLSIGIGLFLMYIPASRYKSYGAWTTTQESFYEALSRPVWALCWAWVIYACNAGYGGLFNSFLSWRGFLPLSRLTFTAYLVSPTVLVYYYYSRRSLIYILSENQMAYIFIGNVVVSYAGALFISVLFERPLLNVERAVSKKNSANENETRGLF